MNRKKILSSCIVCIWLSAMFFIAFRKTLPVSDHFGHTPDLSSEYLVTQYADETGAQATFYTIENDSCFVIIDGGWADNADAVRKVIRDHDSHVDAWIISHPHRDHAGAFNEIFRDPQDIVIDTVYDNGFDYDFVEANGEPYDDITVMETYYSLTKDDARVTHLKRGDSVKICGLTLETLNTWDESVLYTVGEEKDYQNNASLLFLLKSKNSSMLFCSDIKYDMDALLTESIRNLPPCDYVQVGHHGNWSFSENFYETTGANLFFFDAPAEITDNPDFPACNFKKNLLRQNKAALDFSTAPNRVTLR